MPTQSLLVELLTEELPPKALRGLGEAFAGEIVRGLSDAKFVSSEAQFEFFATPRRLAALIRGVSEQPKRSVAMRKGPSVKSGLDAEGKPTKALEGFLRANGVSFADLKRQGEGKKEFFYFEAEAEAQSLPDALEAAAKEAARKLPVPKLMRWGDRVHYFARPVHGLVAMLGDKVLPVSLFGFEASNVTRGHRFLSQGDVAIPDAESYARVLREQGRVVVSFDERLGEIRAQVERLAQPLGASPAADESLYEEVAALVEWPKALVGTFEEHFLGVPQECLILTMQQNQKYFPLVDAQGKLINKFVVVSNMEIADGDYGNIVKGNERVLRARLSDAAFFYEQDSKETLESRLPKLEGIVYQNKIGSLRERVTRLVALASEIARLTGADAALCERAALLSKCDLVTDMVGEFPELQGQMGYRYALLDKESSIVANAIGQQYMPRFAQDELPQDPVAVAVSLADKIEALVGIFGVGMAPTGDKDPFALRRAALGAIRMLLGLDVDVPALLRFAQKLFPEGALSDSAAEEVYDFMLQRLSVMQQQNFPRDVVAAALDARPAEFKSLPSKLAALAVFRGLPEAGALSAANKRVANLLKKADAPLADVDESLFETEQEKQLLIAVRELTRDVRAIALEKDYEKALRRLAQIKPAVDAFFDGVMVLADDPKARQNRLNLLGLLNGELNRDANIGLLEPEGAETAA